MTSAPTAPAPAAATVPTAPVHLPNRTPAGGATRAAPRRRWSARLASATPTSARPAPPAMPDVSTWPAAELDPRWPHADPGLAAWRYRRILSSVKEQEQEHARETCPKPCCRSSVDIERTEWEVLVATPAAEGWSARPGQTTIVAYDCVGKLLTGQVVDGTVLAFFPLHALRRSIRARLGELHQLHQLHLPKAGVRQGGRRSGAMNGARPPDQEAPRAESHYFLFVGEAGSCLGGMQDFYGAYDTPAAAREAVPEEVHWAEIAAVREGILQVVVAGARSDGGWRWQDLDLGDAPQFAHAPGDETAA